MYDCSLQIKWCDAWFHILTLWFHDWCPKLSRKCPASMNMHRTHHMQPVQETWRAMKNTHTLLKHRLCIQWASFCGHFSFVWHFLLCPNGNGYLTSSWNPGIMLCSLVGLTAIYYTAPISVKHGWRPCLLRGRYFKPLQELCHLSKIETWKRFFESFWKAFNCISSCRNTRNMGKHVRRLLQKCY